jgi:hypothetical protein
MLEAVKGMPARAVSEDVIQEMAGCPVDASNSCSGALVGQ